LGIFPTALPPGLPRHPAGLPHTTGSTANASANMIVGTSEDWLRFDTDEGLRTTVSASNRE
jgi:hypothetical protein